MATASLPTKPASLPTTVHDPNTTRDMSHPDMIRYASQTTKILHRISLHPTLTPYRRRLYRTLLSIPPGRWTTYAALAKHLDSSPRAVGNTLRTNPFAPEVPCHRVLGSGGLLGGYKGVWMGKRKGCGEGGGKGEEKRRLLEEEGVVFDGEGGMARAKGVCFGGFVEVGKKR